MTTRAAINGYGRIGRCLLRAAQERGLAGRLDVVADLAAQPKAITLDMFRASAERHAGRTLSSLQPAALKEPPTAR